MLRTTTLKGYKSTSQGHTYLSLKRVTLYLKVYYGIDLYLQDCRFLVLYLGLFELI